MTRRRTVERWPGLPAALLWALALLLAALSRPPAALAHPLDEYQQAAYITVGPDEIAVELNLTPGVLVAPRVLPDLDPDGDGEIADAEARAYADRVLRDVVLEVDGRRLALAVSRIARPTLLNVQAGYGTIRIFATAIPPTATADERRLSFANAFAPAGAAYQVNAFVDPTGPIVLGPQRRDAEQRSLTVEYAVAGEVLADAPVSAPTDAEGAVGRLLAVLDDPAASPWGVLPALALAGGLGALHALTPGHGKTLAAAYLVGSRGTVRHAAALGAAVTVTHTASVVAIGLLALVAGRYVVPEVLVPVLSVLSGVLVIAIGVRLVRQRLADLRGRALGHVDDRERDPRVPHDHIHEHGRGLVHHHGDGRVHAHLPPGGSVRPADLVALGVSGGLVPCPEALAIMIVAVGLNRVGFGLGLIAAFSLGLAAVLIVTGVLLVRSRALVDRLGGFGGGWGRVLPLGSAAIVTVLGLGIVVGGLAAFVR